MKKQISEKKKGHVLNMEDWTQLLGMLTGIFLIWGIFYYCKMALPEQSVEMGMQ